MMMMVMMMMMMIMMIRFPLLLLTGGKSVQAKLGSVVDTKPILSTLK